MKDSPIERVFLSIGSNLDNPERNLRAALNNLSASNLPMVSKSSIYRTEPVDFLDQPEFLNLACEVRCSMTPDQLLKTCQLIEREMGRIRLKNKGPRIIDIDILYFGKRVINGKGIEIPHPRILFRRFVLEPLAEIAPEFMDPIKDKPIFNLLEDCTDTSLVDRTNLFLE
jgi:2-amino-4-hydroxy-6-hydroxymethyldihydropteridine diphosphokinase